MRGHFFPARSSKDLRFRSLVRRMQSATITFYIRLRGELLGEKQSMDEKTAYEFLLLLLLSSHSDGRSASSHTRMHGCWSFPFFPLLLSFFFPPRDIHYLHSSMPVYENKNTYLPTLSIYSCTFLSSGWGEMLFSLIISSAYWMGELLMLRKSAFRMN